MNLLYIDTETIRNPANPGKPREDDRLPAAPHHLIVAARGVVLL